MGEHTPGPWIADPPFVSAHKREDGSLAHDIVSAAGGVRVGPAQREANAYLIAAAPDMYEALDQAEAILYRVAHESGLTHSDAEGCAYQCSEALAKARGESNE